MSEKKKVVILWSSPNMDGATAGTFVRVKPIYQDIMDFAKEKDIPLFRFVWNGMQIEKGFF